MKTPTADRSAKKKKTKTKVVSFPAEIVEDIVSRLPVKSILRSKSVSKPWLNLISSPSFTKLQFSRATTTHLRNGFFISAYDHSNCKCYYLTAASDGGPLTLLMTLGDDTSPERSHLNGIICFTSRAWKTINSQAFVVNPATHKVFRLPDINSPSNEYSLIGYLYGFDESRNELKILLVKYVYKTKTPEFMVFSMSTFSWRTIDLETPVGFDWNRLAGGFGGGVCLDSVVHTMLHDFSYDILAFDFVKEKFSVISIPEGILPDYNGEDFRKIYIPSLTKVSGCLGFVLHDWEMSEVHVWLLQDYQKRVWVKETIKFPKSWNDLVGRVPPAIDVTMDGEIVFCLCKRTENVITIPVYNMKTQCFKSVPFTLDGQFASSKSVSFCNISCYVETTMPLVDNWSKTSHRKSD